jgi:cholinesterase
MISGASEDVSGLPESPLEMEMQALMQRAWAVFADNPVNGLKKEMGWPVYGSIRKLPNQTGIHLNAIC